ncbi:hypothetical protein K458DRAFT_391135 [Lentithecium fluviatile CBS 122367]|uniref:Mid2 domain-containing protein n=1 Tax=Lentithecium fluviatile CBS 122367 TaxID=1168545 RepID=A0A6G1IVU2_9PLEO|nr:hypothetical protein K458DRAFT_391135 [Lentithecium fluviatile CBS 122367]
MVRSVPFFAVAVSVAVYSVAIAAEQTCYGLNGTVLDSTYGPCNTDAKHSGCCAIHRPAGSVDICLDNGLCMATTGQYMGTIWQDGCTDPTGQDEGCPKMCPDARDDFNGSKPVLAWNVQMCDYGSYCCREANDRNNCCNNATAPKIKTNSLGAFQFQTSTAGDSSTATAAAASSTQSSSTKPTQVFGTAVSTGTPFTSSPTTSSTPDLCAAEKRKTVAVGGAVGGVLGAALVGALIAMFWLYKKEKHQRRIKEHYEAQFEVSSAYWPRPQTVVVDADSDLSGTPAEKDAEVVVLGEGDEGRRRSA